MSEVQEHNMRNVVSSKKLKRSESRLLIVDDNQVRYNKIIELFEEKSHQVHAILLDDLQSFEKQLSLQWDLIIFGRAYDLKLEQALTLLQKSRHPYVPVLLLRGEDYHPDQYSVYLNKGVYDILNLDFLASTYMMFVRALSYSRVLQNEQRLNEELETIQQQTQTLVEESRKAVALISEGIHVHANDEYLKLFGLADIDSVIGLPILDVLQPKNIQQFKQSFKKVSQGQFDQTGLEIITSNPNAVHKALKLEYLPAEDEGIQIIVDISERKRGGAGNDKAHPISQALGSIQRHLKNNPANCSAIVSISLKQCPESVLEGQWDIFQGYFNNIPKYLQEQSNISIYKIDALLYLTLVQAESQAVLDAQLMGLKALQKPRLIDVNGQSLSLQLRLGYSLWEQEEYSEDEFKALIGSAFNTALPEVDGQNDPLALDLLSLDINTTMRTLGASRLGTLTSAIKTSSVSLTDGLSLVEDEPTTSAQLDPNSVIESALELELDGLDNTPTAVEKPLNVEQASLSLVSDSSTNVQLEPTESLELSIEPIGQAQDSISMPELSLGELSIEPITADVAPASTADLTLEMPTLELDVEPSVQPASDIQLAEPSLSLDIAGNDTPELVVPTSEIQVQPETAQAVAPAPTPVAETPVAPASLPSVGRESWSPLLVSLQQNLQHGLVSLRYQQFYDKDDQNTHTYEVTAAFIFENAWQELTDLEELNNAPDLSWELDRWKVIEACKQLHHFVKQHPNAQIIVNMNQHSMVHPELPELVSKVSKMIGGRQEFPLVLQFSEKAISENVGIAQHHLQVLKQNGVQLAVRDFGNLLLSNTILERIPFDYVGLARSFTKMINKEDDVAELQAKIDAFMEIREVSMSLHGLDDMNSFANAWNVSARYIQGDYFQKKMDHLVDVNDQ